MNRVTQRETGRRNGDEAFLGDDAGLRKALVTERVCGGGHMAFSDRGRGRNQRHNSHLVAVPLEDKGFSSYRPQRHFAEELALATESVRLGSKERFRGENRMELNQSGSKGALKKFGGTKTVRDRIRRGDEEELVENGNCRNRVRSIIHKQISKHTEIRAQICGSAREHGVGTEAEDRRPNSNECGIRETVLTEALMTDHVVNWPGLLFVMTRGTVREKGLDVGGVVRATSSSVGDFYQGRRGAG
ncbi:hypothetical protein BU15DRAFT_64010 [Melanogaster broomeanus]|nr:hypothetical protein BU15DRAFT_64010 [Melanogaster broomeanus]